MSSRVLARIAAKAHSAQQCPNEPRSEGTSTENPKKRQPTDNIIDLDVQNPNKRMQIEHSLPPPQTTPLRPILSQLNNDKDKEVIVKIEAGAMWTAGLVHPMQALSVFDLPADAANYNNHQPVDLINRARRRFGRFAAEFVHLSNMFERQEKEEGRQQLLSETLSLRNERRQLGARVEELQKTNKNLEAAKKGWEVEKGEFVKSHKELSEQNSNLVKDIAELKSENVQLKQNVLERDQELEKVKTDLAAAELDAENALKDGYTICYEKIQATGVDVAGLSYADYVSDLADQLAKQTLNKTGTSTAQSGGGENEQMAGSEEQANQEKKKTGNAP